MGRSKPVLVLVGFSGSGKSAVGKKLAEEHGLTFADVDTEVEKLVGDSIKNLIREEGEKVFRDKESQVLEQLLSREINVIATGGGTLLREANRKVLKENVTLVHLTASVEELVRRISSDGKENRPIVDSDDLRTRVVELLGKRKAVYDTSGIRIWTDFADLKQIAKTIQRSSSVVTSPRKAPVSFIPANLGKGIETEVVVGASLLNDLVGLIRSKFKNCQKVAIVTDSNIKSLHGEKLHSSLGAASYETHLLSVDAGEKAKSMENVTSLCEQLVAKQFSRADVVIALGGGVIGDLAGLVASLVLRGVNLIQMPTSVMAQVDASIGGKTGVNLYSEIANGKNLVGTFYPATFVVSDTDLLQTLPERSFVEGLAEVIKYGMIHSEEFLLWLEKNVDQILKRDRSTLREIVEFSSRAKLTFVVGDLEDKTGERAKLNFGHTIGHAVERLTNYQEYFHGEAVAIGMVQAAKLGEHFGISNSEVSGRLVGILEKLNLPTTVPEELITELSKDKKDSLEVFNQRWRAALVADKKRVGDELHFIFVERPGCALVKELDLGDVVTGFADICREQL